MLPMAQWIEAATTIKVRGYLWLFAGAFVQRTEKSPKSQLSSTTYLSNMFQRNMGLSPVLWAPLPSLPSVALLVKSQTGFRISWTTTYFSAVGSLSWLPGFWRSLGDKGQQTIFASSIWWPGPNDEQRQVKPAAAKNEMRRRTICRRLKVKGRNWKPIQKKARPRHFILLRGVFMTNNIIE